MEKIRRIRIALLAFMALLLVSAIYFIERRVSPAGPSISIGNISSGIGTLHLTERTPGKVRWELWADKAKISNDEQTSELENPKILVYYGEKETPVNVTAKTGTLDARTKQIFLTGGVNAESNGSTLATDHVSWNNDKGILETEGEVEIAGDGFTLRGIGMQAASHEETVELLSDISGHFLLKKPVETSNTPQETGPDVKEKTL